METVGPVIIARYLFVVLIRVLTVIQDLHGFLYCRNFSYECYFILTFIIVIQIITSSHGCSVVQLCPFLVDRTVVALMPTVLFLSVVCTECIVAKRCILEQKLLLADYRKLCMRN